MKCPRCGNIEDKVVDSRPSTGGMAIRRRRECLKCQNRFTTTEVNADTRTISVPEMITTLVALKDRQGLVASTIDKMLESLKTTNKPVLTDQR